MSGLDLKSLTCRLGTRDVVRAVSFSLGQGELGVVIGPNGAGKSTLLKALAGLVPAQGQAQLGAVDLLTLKPAERPTHMAYLPQERAIVWDLSALDVACLGDLMSPFPAVRERALAALAQHGLGDMADTPVSRLSGGQRARVLLARLMVSTAPLWLLDEPLSALDPAWQRRALGLLKGYASEGGTVLISLHDLELAARFADKLILMHEGALVAAGAPQEVLTPANLAQVFELNGRYEDGGLRVEGLVI